MKTWEANLDVQFVTNVYSCVMYLVSYVSKPERTLGDVLKAVSTSSAHLGAKRSMRSVAQKFLTHREVNGHEAVYRLLSLPLTQGSRQIILSTQIYLKERTRLFKPRKVLEQMDEDDPDMFLMGALDRYKARPSKLENMCLCEFLTTYKTSSSKPNFNEARADNTSEEEKDDQPSKHIVLKDNMGQMTLRKTTAIVRYHQLSKNKQLEQYFHSQLLLYRSLRQEVQDLCHDTYKEAYVENLEVIASNRARFENFADEVGDVLENMEQFGIVEDSWESIVPETEKERTEERIEGPEVEENPLNAFGESQLNIAANKDTRGNSFQYEMIAERMSTTDWNDCVLSLNTKQYTLHKFIVEWATEMILTHKIPKPDPFYLFLTGGAGVGKSHLVRTIVQTVNRIFAINNQAEDSHVLVCAPTGAATYNISGYTCHAAFLLPLHQKKTDDDIPLSTEKFAIVKETFSNIKLIVIDEISMAGADTLLTIHRRICDVMSNQLPFGGDLLQLPAVAMKPVFSKPTDEMSAIYGSLWQTHFKILELTEVQRHNNDLKFADMLNRVRVGQPTDEDIAMLNRRQVLPSSENFPSGATHIFAYNRDVNANNDSMLHSLTDSLYTFTAKDSKREDQTRRVEISTFSDNAGGLLKTLILGVGLC